MKARGVFSGCRFQIADLMCFLTLTFSYFLWMISLNRYGVYGEISNNQAVSQSFWNWQALALQRPAQKLVEGTRRCWAQRSVGITTLLTILLYWQVWMEMMLKLDFRYNWSLWPKSLKMMYIYIYLGYLGSCPHQQCHWPLDVPGGRVMTSSMMLSCPVWDLLGMFGIFRNTWMSDSQ